MGKKEKESPKTKSPPPTTNKGRALWICLFIFGCGWMFVLGILVGRGTAPVQFDIENLQKELASLKEAVIKKEGLRFKIDSDIAGHKTDMNFYEDLKTSDGNVKQKNDQFEAASKQNQKPLPKAADSKIEDKNVTGGAEVEEPSRNKPVPALSPEAEPEKKLTIQVASLRDPEVADRMVAQLKDKWYPAYRAVAEVSGNGIWYRVRIGSFKNRAEAQSTMERLQKEKIDAVLLPY
ncbi:MAG: SPOR domain-containing protein [Proteobacteria bacterium]|nr:SPOR domain-containing protein [Pseudomonadota bacterium]